METAHNNLPELQHIKEHEGQIEGPLFSNVLPHRTSIKEIFDMVDPQALSQFGDLYLKQIDKAIGDRVLYVLRAGSYLEISSDSFDLCRFTDLFSYPHFPANYREKWAVYEEQLKQTNRNITSIDAESLLADFPEYGHKFLTMLALKAGIISDPNRFALTQYYSNRLGLDQIGHLRATCSLTFDEIYNALGKPPTEMKIARFLDIWNDAGLIVRIGYNCEPNDLIMIGPEGHKIIQNEIFPVWVRAITETIRKKMAGEISDVHPGLLVSEGVPNFVAEEIARALAFQKDETVTLRVSAM